MRGEEEEEEQEEKVEEEEEEQEEKVEEYGGRRWNKKRKCRRNFLWIWTTECKQHIGSRPCDPERIIRNQSSLNRFTTDQSVSSEKEEGGARTKRQAG